MELALDSPLASADRACSAIPGWLKASVLQRLLHEADGLDPQQRIALIQLRMMLQAQFLAAFRNRLHSRTEERRSISGSPIVTTAANARTLTNAITRMPRSRPCRI